LFVSSIIFWTGKALCDFPKKFKSDSARGDET
jgi:hypothetical protein